jgi:hypothetical protein
MARCISGPEVEGVLEWGGELEGDVGAQIRYLDPDNRPYFGPRSLIRAVAVAGMAELR